MERYKKRIVALTLASLVTIAGSFANSNYKNSLTGLRLENTPTGDVRLVLQTRTAYQGSITPVRRDANTYILTLPEVKSEADIPDLQNVYGNVESVTIRTMPYSNSAKGYTRITLKTNQQSLKLLTTNQVYIPKNINKNTNMNTQNVTQNRSVDNSRIRQQINEEIAKKTAVEEIEQQESEATPTYQSIKLEPVTPSEEPVVVVETKSSENLFIRLWRIL